MVSLKYRNQLKKILSLHDQFSAMSDEELKAKTAEFKERYANGESLNHMLPEAFATVREASNRVLGMEPYPVQLIGGMVLHDGNISEQKTGEGKASPVSERIPTPNGWRTVGDIKVGDYIFDRYGKPTLVTGVYPQGKREVYEVTFADGRKVRCADYHLWTVYRNYHTELRTLETKEIIADGLKSGRAYKYHVPTATAVEYIEQPLPLDPYVLGLMLGNGCKNPQGVFEFSSDDIQTVTFIANYLHATAKKSHEDNYTWHFSNGEISPRGRGLSRVKIKDVAPELEDLLSHTLSFNKYIPEIYKLASIPSRWALIQGLMDSDGNIYERQNTQELQRYAMQFSTSSERLKDDILEVLYSLGVSATAHLSRKAGVRAAKHDQYTIRIKCPHELKPNFFRLTCKKDIALRAALYKPAKKLYDRIAITNIEDLGYEEEQVCFTVNNEEHLYLVGDYIVTHNTLVAAMPSYLNAIPGNGVHVVTVNDYLAKRDAEEIGKVHEFLGLSVGCVLNEMENAERKAAYACDITYVTNNEAGFDYLRDNMVVDAKDKVQRGLNYAIIDEVDSILIDEARTPLIISRKGEESNELYIKCDYIVKRLKKGERIEGETKFDAAVETGDYYADEKRKNAVLTEAGTEKVEKYFKINNLADPENAAIMHGITQALKANAIMHKDKDYVVTDDGKVDIVDEFTGRILKGRRFSDGLHQAIEAKEGVEIQSENMTVATVTFQHFFNRYNKKSGMTGTAMTEKSEFKEIYHMDVIAVPTNKPVIRKDLEDYVFLTKKAKYKAVVDEIKRVHETGQPILVGTTTIDVSEFLHRALIREGIPHTVLNAKYHEMEAGIVALAGQVGAVTIATNMAGRGTDIKLGEGAAELGGLYVLGTERHESRRIDNQLRGRSGRQGDPGISRFYISLEDDLMRLYGQDNLIEMLKSLNGGDENMLMENKSLSKAISRAQRKIEGQHYSTRKSLLDFDNVNDEQRNLVYDERDQILGTGNLDDTYIRMATEAFETLMENDFSDYRAFCLKMKSIFGFDMELPEEQPTEKEMRVFMAKYIPARYEQFKHCCDGVTSVQGNVIEDGTPYTDAFARKAFLRILDRHWVNHIDALEHIREGINLQSYGQHDPKIYYKQEAYRMFDEMLERVRIGVTSALFQAKIQQKSN